MRTNLIEREVGILGDFSTKNFYIQTENVVHIVNILRNKLYNNKVLAVIREYVTNAIDATIENNSSRPIEITLPSELNHYFKVRDFGRGLSQEDIENIFISYGASTKRNSDDFTGCIGIGSKAAFSYSESFLINSYYEGKLYTYAAYLDDTGLGSISLFNSIPTEEDSGLEISVPIKNEDFSKFRSEFENYSIALSFPYKLLGEPSDYDLKTPDIFSTNYGIILSHGKPVLNSPEMFIQESVFLNFQVVMGNVAYNIDKDWFWKNVDNPTFNRNTHVIFKVPMGEIEFSSNREQIEMTNSNAKVLKSYMERFKDFYFESIKSDFFNKNGNINSYSKLSINIRLSGVLKDPEQNRIFDLSKLEYTLDSQKLLDLTSDIFVKTVSKFGKDYRFKKSYDIARIQSMVNTNSNVFNHRNYPLLIVGTSNRAKDEICLHTWRNTLVNTRGIAEVREKLNAEVPGYSFYNHSDVHNPIDLPSLFLVYPKSDISVDEYISKVRDLGFFILKVSDLENYGSSEPVKISKSITVISPRLDLGNPHRNFTEVTTIREIYDYIETTTSSPKIIKLINCPTQKINQDKNLFLSYAGNKVQFYDTYHSIYFYNFVKLCSQILNFIPVFVKMNAKDLANAPYEVLAFEDFNTEFLNKCFEIRNSFSAKDSLYLKTLRLGYRINQYNFDSLSEFLHGLGFRDMESFREFVSWLTIFEHNYRHNPENSIQKKNTKLNRNLKKLKLFMKNTSSPVSFSSQIPKDRRDFIELLYRVLKPIIFLNAADCQVPLPESSTEYLKSVCSKIIKADTFFFLRMNYLRHEILNTYSYYEGHKEKNFNSINSKFIAQGF